MTKTSDFRLFLLHCNIMPNIYKLSQTLNKNCKSELNRWNISHTHLGIKKTRVNIHSFYNNLLVTASKKELLKMEGTEEYWVNRYTGC